MTKELISQTQMARNKFLKLNRKIYFFIGMNKDVALDIVNILNSIEAEQDKVLELSNTAEVRLTDLADKLPKKS